jgi:4-amino-4-deoxy-L-arabinose transferase-like glycosyltransferase
MVLTPDLPLLFFYALAVLLFDKALNEPSALVYGLFGLVFGLGFTSKYHIVLLAPCLLFYLLLSKRWREVRWKYLPLVLGMALLGAMPVWYWNYQHDWISFRFQIDHGVGLKSWKWIWPLEYLASVLLLVVPVYWKAMFQAIRENKHKLLICLSVPIILFFLLTSLRAKVEANWSQLAFLPLLSILAIQDPARWKARFVFGFWIGAFAVVLVFWTQPWFPGCPEKLCEPRRYEAVLPVMDRYQPVMASNYQMASYLWFHKKKPVYKLKEMSRHDYFDTFAMAIPMVDSFYLAKLKITDLPPWLIEQGYRSEKIEEIDEEMVLLRVFR